MEEKPIMVVEGYKMSLLLFKNKIKIERAKGFMNLSLHGLKGDKEIFLKFITAIQLKKAGTFTKGYIQFTIMGGNESIEGLLGAVQDENTVVFEKNQEQEFMKIKQLIEDKINS